MMVTDASIWVSSLHHDIHHQATLAWLKEYAATGNDLFAPNLLLAEIGGAIARRTGRSHLAHAALRRLAAYSFLRIIPIYQPLAAVAAELAADYHLRGADAVYAALAYSLDVPLLSWDNQQVTRVQKVIKAGPPGTLFDSNGHTTPPS